MQWTSPVSAASLWSAPISNRAEKEKVAALIAEQAKSGEVIGAGSGSTAYLALLALAERAKREKLDIAVIPTSHEVDLIAGQLGLRTTTLQAASPAWGFDGTDEIDDRNRLIKGRGGALLREKILIASSPKTFILADHSKKVERLGCNFAVPVEVVPAALHHASQRLERLGGQNITLRMATGKDGPIITESGNLLLDVRFAEIPDTLERELAAIVGVAETGLFIGYAIEAVYPT